MSKYNPRPKQKEVLSFRNGYMGVAAVPGSGKTWTLSVLASELITGGYLEEEQEVLIVTLVNSAVDNFSRRVGEFIEDKGLFPQVGYRVRTLHGLAHDIVRERPDLAGLSNAFQIIDERSADAIRKDVSMAWLKGHPYDLDEYLSPDLESNESKTEWVRRDQFPDLVSRIASSFIRYSKDMELTPERVRSRLEEIPIPLPLAEMGLEIYTGYQRALAYRDAVDFDDLIRLALAAIRIDPQFLERLRLRWPYILEDEAQDSSLLQENILRELAGPEGNWVRVGDPNQAIFETFTTADPRHLREFISEEAGLPRQLPNSGRSTQSIINLANYLIDWTTHEHPREDVRDALGPPPIEATPPGDPQPNPADDPSKIRLIGNGYSPEEELSMVSESVLRWIGENPDKTVAILVPTNFLGFQLVDLFRNNGIEPIDSLLRSSSSTRFAAGAIANILGYLSNPKSAKKLSTVYRVWRRTDRDDEQLSERLRIVSGLIKKVKNVEDYIWPRADYDWLEEIQGTGTDEGVIEELLDFRKIIKRWQGTVLLPIDQIVLTLAQDLFTNSTELAIAHKLALLLNRAIKNNIDWNLPELTEELAVIAKNERRFIGFSEEDLGFDPDQYNGRVVISTMHKAKGLEWDRVYLMSVSNYNFPSGQEFDSYISEKWFIRDKINLEAETLAQLDALLSKDEFDWYEEGEASEQARIDYVKERLRLLYVGITRAKKELVITWNTGRKGNQQQALPLIALQVFVEENGYGASK
jgi:DNA helicase II / ATP-dependent DNA helicase PcrA